GCFIEEQAPAIDPARAFTLEAMVHPPAATADNALIMAFASREGLQGGLFEEEGQWFWRLGDRHTAGQLLGPAPSDPAHVALAYSNGTAQYYLDGDLIKAFETSMPTAGRGLQILFGGQPEPPEMDWSGRLENIALYDRALDARTIGIHHRLLRETIAARTAPEPISVRARLLTASAIPAPEDIAPYRRGLVANEYVVIEGPYKNRRFLGAHWVILDGQVLPDAARRPGVEYDMLVDPFEERPELRGDRLTMDIDDLTLDLYFDRNL
ncbi:MAG: LamG-like jellyroll fold domain-containing protein, partial [Kiritimatiellia bacterium]